MLLAKGTAVTLYTPDNPRLHGASAVIVEPTEWGAIVETEASGSGQYRASHDEMVIVETNGHKSESSLPGQRGVARQQGYTGDACDVCGSFRVLRSGPCLKCEECGTSGGCG